MNEESKENKEEPAVVRELTVENALGLHARPATMFAKVASQFDSDITVEKDGTQVSGKSLMGLLGLEAARGTKLKIVAEGHDKEEAVEQLERLVKSKFEDNE